MSPRMKHLTVVSVVGVTLLILLISIFAVEISSTVPAELELSKALAVVKVQETKVTITGVVKEISDTTLLVERTVKGKVEFTEFVLDKPLEKIKTGDKVKVSYTKKEGKNIVTGVTPVISKKISKKPHR